MAWTTPRTWVAGEIVTAALGNTHWRDNLLALYAGALSVASQAAGDLFYASSSTQLARLAKGTAYQVLRMNAGATAPEWAAASGGLSQTFRGVHLRTHPDYDVAAYKVQLIHADAINFVDSNGIVTEVTSGIDRLVADITASGAGGLDTGSEGASRWYEVYAIRKSSDGTLNLLLHRAKDYFLDEQQTSQNGAFELRNGAADQVKVGQTFDTDVTGNVERVDFQINLQAALTGRIWAEIYATSGGVPTGAILATSNKLDASSVSSSNQWVAFTFRSPVSLTAGTTYAVVLAGDYTAHTTNNIQVRSQNTNPYAAGTAVTYNGTNWSADANNDLAFKVYVTENDSAVTMPTGYDQKCKIGYVYNNSSSDFRSMFAVDRMVNHRQVQVTSIASTLMTLTDLSEAIPPGAVRAQLGAQNGTASSYVVASGMMDGFAGSVTSHQVHDTGVPHPIISGLVNTEFQAMYFSRGTGGTCDLYVMGFTW